MKENVKSVVVLTAICLVVAVLLSVTNFYTAPIIEENKAAASLGSLTVVMPDAQGFEEITPLPDDTPATVKNVYKETSGLGYVVVLATTSQYSSDDMGITVGIGTDGKISGITLTSYAESKDFGAEYPQTYIGVDSALSGIDTVAGVTYSSTAFKNAITDAFTALFAVGDVAEGEKSEEQLIEEVSVLALPGCVDALGKAQLGEPTALYGIVDTAMEAANGVGYVAIFEKDGNKVVAGINAFNDTKFFDLEGNDITDQCADLAETIKSTPSIAEGNLESDSKTVAYYYDPEAVLTPIHSTGTFDTILGGFIVESAEGIQYAFISNYFGFAEPMKFVVILDDNGAVVSVKCKSSLIQEAEYYGANPLTDESGYKNGLTGLTETDDSILVSGATITTNCARKALDSAFAAFKTVKEAA